MASFLLIRILNYVFLLLNLLEQTGCQRNCGKSFRQDIESYIVDGEIAQQGDWPWMAALMEFDKNTGNNLPICSGFLIDKKHIISAAHCFQRKQTSVYTARIGHVNLNLCKNYSIDHISVHESFEDLQFYEDIAVVTLSKDVDIPDFNSVCLPPRGALRNLTGRGATFVGWGATRKDGEMTHVLKQLEAIPVWSNKDCHEPWEIFERSFPQGIISRMLCAGFQDEPGKDICWGDSGGPLMILEQNRWYAVGVAAFGYSCGRSDFPAVYTRLSEYLDWIDKTKNTDITRSVETPETKSTNLDEHCDGSNDDPAVCVDIRECDWAVSILIRGGRPKVCGWVNDIKNSQATKWPKVWCGVSQEIRKVPKAPFISSEERRNDCGILHREAKEKDSWPWMVSINVSDRIMSHVCNGVMIDRRHFVASSVCFYGLRPKTLSAKIGNAQTGKTYEVTKVKIFKEHIEKWDCGIVLGTLSREVEDPDFTPICLPHSLSSRNLTGMAVRNIGLLPNQPSNNACIISNYECNQKYEEEKFNKNIEWHICTNYTLACEIMDLLMLKDHGKWILIGVPELFMTSCSEYKPVPTPYKRISEYQDWILESISSF